MSSDALQQVAGLLAQRNSIDAKIAELISRPMTAGHLGEWIARHVFNIQLEDSATTPAYDGRFRSGPLHGRTVNVKWYLKREGLLDMSTTEGLDDYLVMTGPPAAAASSHGQTRPWRIHNVYLFDARALHADLLERGQQIGTASSLRTQLWTKAEIYPNQVNPRLPLTDEQIHALQLF